ncbi:MAG: NADH-quinone oxidoreductase subunit L [Deltaproteobacteria bacterium]|nr:NADH-quinone oxidoreductase subunit L [Deltaproteobacteria bacterium]
MQNADLSFILRNSWLVPALPLFSFAVVALFARRFSEKAAGVVATASVFGSAVAAGLVARDYFRIFPPGTDGQALVPWSIEWLRYQDRLSITVGVLVDPISVLLMVVVTTVSFLVHLYSTGYMRGERGYGRYFAFLNLFTFSMLGLVVASNILQMYMCWELVGLSSFLLIGFYYSRPAAVAASKKAFIVTRFADLGFFIGIILLGYHGFNLLDGQHPFDFITLSSPASLEKLAGATSGFLGVGLLPLAAVLVFMGAAGKSAMFPLHIWLPDAMEGPTPVSALIHAATMVVAGVYLVARMFGVFAAAGDALLLVAYVGAFTCFFAAVIACTQDDVKRVLAFSTLSQIGYMMFALGVSSAAHPMGYTASMFHLFTHAFFKALLFLGAGAVIHATHTSEIWKMGGLRRKMPLTHATFLVATLSIAGIWPFSGFFSKDEILLSALASGHHGVFAIGLLTAGLTAFYMFRLYFLVFSGFPRDEQAGHAHEAPLVMLIPLVALAILSVLAGWVPFSDFVRFGGGGGFHEEGHALVAALGTVAALLGIGFSWFLYAGKGTRAEALAARFGALHLVVKHKFYIDEIYLFITHKIIFRCIAAPVAWFDRNVVDGGVNLSGWCARVSSRGLTFLQTGQAQAYGAWLVGGSIIVLLVAWAARL